MWMACVLPLRPSLFPSPVFGGGVGVFADGGGQGLMTPSVADYRATSPEDGGGVLRRMFLQFVVPTVPRRPSRPKASQGGCGWDSGIRGKNPYGIGIGAVPDVLGFRD